MGFTIAGLLNKIPFKGYKSILGLALATFIVPITPASIAVFGVPIAAKALASAAAAFFTGTGLANKVIK